MESDATHRSEGSVPVLDHAPVESEHRMGSIGSVVAILLIVALLVVGAFYVWGQRLAEQQAQAAAAVQ